MHESDPNPYQSPSPYKSEPFETADDGSVTDFDGVVEMLIKTRPWVRFLSILGFMGAVLMILIGLFAGAAGMAMGNMQTAIFLIYLPFGFLYYFPSMYLYRYANRITDFESSPRMDQLATTLEAQKSFWRFAGILALVFLVIYVLIIVISVLAVLA